MIPSHSGSCCCDDCVSLSLLQRGFADVAVSKTSLATISLLALCRGFSEARAPLWSPPPQGYVARLAARVSTNVFVRDLDTAGGWRWLLMGCPSLEPSSRSTQRWCRHCEVMGAQDGTQHSKMESPWLKHADGRSVLTRNSLEMRGEARRPRG